MVRSAEIDVGLNKLEANKPLDPAQNECKSSSLYSFCLSVQHVKKNKNIINLNIGGVQLDIMIDSGANCNAIDNNTWGVLKSKGVTCRNSPFNSKLSTYGKGEDLTIIGQFETLILPIRTVKKNR